MAVSEDFARTLTVTSRSGQRSPRAAELTSRHCIFSHPMLGDPVFTKWFPLGRSMDLVEATPTVTAEAVLTQLCRFLEPEPLTVSEVSFRNLDSLFGSIDSFTNVPTRFLCLPTHSAWTAIYYNSFLCDGYDSLCHCLSHFHDLRTIHWESADETAIAQPGTILIHRQPCDGEPVRERTVSCTQQDRHWTFYESGPPLKEEDIMLYSQRIKSRRFNEEVSLALLAHMGAHPREESFYDFSQPVHCIERTDFSDSIVVEDFAYIQGRIKRA